ncbi:MAG: phage portal protein [Myxococcota bacterium]
MNPLEAAALRRARRSSTTGGGYQAAFSGAIHNRLTADWILAGIQSADQEVRQNLKTLKARSRELARNNPHAGRFLDLKADNILGDEGIQLQAQVLGPDGEFQQAVNQEIEDGWKRWCEVGICTADGREAWQDVERMGVIEEARDGDTFIRLLPSWRENEFGFALQPIDPDQIDVDLNETSGTDARGNRRREIRMGVEINEWGRPVAYHIHSNHPSEPGARDTGRVRVPAEQMIHWYRPYRVGQTRGVPDFAPVLLTQKMLQGYEEAELVASRIAAAKGGFFERSPEAIQLLNLGGEDSDPFTMEVEPGLFESLPAGWKFSQWDPTHPTTAFPDFHKAMLRTIATGLGISYNVLAQDLEGVSFSSIRTQMLSERETWRSIQANLWRHVHTRVYRAWLLWAITTGALELPARDPSLFQRVRWQPRGWDWVDPMKDSQASMLELRMGVNSRTRIAAAKGRNFEDLVEEQRRERELMEAAGLEISTDAGMSGGSSRDGEEGSSDASPSRLSRLFGDGTHARTGRSSAPTGTGVRNGTHAS